MKYLFIVFLLSAFLLGCSNQENNSFEDMNIQATIDAGIKIALEKEQINQSTKDVEIQSTPYVEIIRPTPVNNQDANKLFQALQESIKSSRSNSKAIPTYTPTATPTVTLTPTPTVTLTPAITPIPTSTPDPFTRYTISAKNLINEFMDPTFTTFYKYENSIITSHGYAMSIQMDDFREQKWIEVGSGGSNDKRMVRCEVINQYGITGNVKFGNYITIVGELYKFDNISIYLKDCDVLSISNDAAVYVAPTATPTPLPLNYIAPPPMMAPPPGPGLPGVPPTATATPTITPTPTATPIPSYTLIVEEFLLERDILNNEFFNIWGLDDNFPDDMNAISDIGGPGDYCILIVCENSNTPSTNSTKTYSNGMEGEMFTSCNNGETITIDNTGSPNNLVQASRVMYMNNSGVTLPKGSYIYSGYFLKD